MIKYDKVAAEKLRDSFVQYSKELESVTKEMSDIITEKNGWADEKRKVFDVHMQVIYENLKSLSKAQLEFAQEYTQKIKELE